MVDLAADYNLELLATGVVLLDADLHIRALNLSAENLLEVSASRAVGSQLEEFLDESNEWYPLLRQALADNYPMVRRAVPMTTRTGRGTHCRHHPESDRGQNRHTELAD